MDNLWSSPCTWQAERLEWRFEYNSLSAKRTITAPGLTLDVPIADTGKFPSPQAWLEAWAKKNKKRPPSQDKEEALTLELDLFPQSEPLPEAVSVEIVTDELTPEEERERLFLERQVERAFYQAGKALRELRDRRLYRSTHPTFEEYCQDRFGFGRHAANRLIAGASVVENLVTIGSQILPTNEMVTIGAQNQSEEMVTIGHQNQSGEMVTIGTQILPTSERQVRPLTQLEPDQQREAWQQAVSEAGGKVPSSRLVKDIVQRIRERTRVPIPYRIGDVCSILVKDNPELRGLGDFWCIVTEVREFSCLVRVWKGEYLVKEENLKDLGYSPEQQEAMRKISERLFQLQPLKEEETAAAILEALGKLKRPYLTALEERLLELLESIGQG
jgi:hypothetical protein